MLLFRILPLLVAGLFAVTPVRAQEKVAVVASISILADMARNVGGERVSVTSLIGADGDSHVYAPTPGDAQRVAAARLVLVNGLGLEGWLPRLVKSAGSKAKIVTVTTGIKPIGEAGKGHSHGHSHAHGADPHAWQSVVLAKTYVANIRDALIEADTEGAQIYRANAANYLAKLDALDADVRADVAKIPAARRKVIVSHDAFGYFAREYGIAFVAPRGVSTESEPSARDVAAIITQIRKAKIPAVFMENISDPRMMRRIADETGAKIGGTLYSDSLTGEKGPAPTYIDMVRHNIKTLTSALAE